MRVLLFGGSGQLGLEITKRAIDLNFEIVAPVINDIDIADRKSVVEFSERMHPQLVINAAAYTAVDKAETEREAAFAVNAQGAENVAWGAKACGVRLIHVSTDYVYGGTLHTPISEDTSPDPLNVYGVSKLAGDQAVTRILPNDSVVVRTSSLHGARGENFVHTMLRLMKEKERIQVVDDQTMSPTWAGWLSEVLLDIARLMHSDRPKYPILHACSGQAVTWYEFACMIQQLAQPVRSNGLAPCSIEKTTASTFPRPAQRPKYSVMSVKRLEEILQRQPLGWVDGLRAHLQEIGELAKM